MAYSYATVEAKVKTLGEQIEEFANVARALNEVMTTDMGDQLKSKWTSPVSSNWEEYYEQMNSMINDCQNKVATLNSVNSDFRQYEG